MKNRPAFWIPVLALLMMCTVVQAAAERPNVILIMADDLGYNDLSCYESKKQSTPVLDKMAREGMRLTSFYAGATVCSPSRMALLSGSYPARLGWRGGVLGYGMPARSGLSKDVVTIAELFKASGYRTAVSGKWHVGEKDLFPTHHGFDDSYIIPNSNNMSRDIYRGDELVHKAFDNRKLTQTFTEEVIRVINVESDKPFFIYVPYSAPHFPADAHPEWSGHSKNADYGDVVEELDQRIGEILEALKAKHIDEQTLVIFISDNGPEPGQRKFASAEPYSGLKWSAYEGGTRVPCIVRWPGVVPAGKTSDEIVAAIDLYPTLAQACGIKIKLPENAQKLDGVNVWDTLVGKAGEHARKDLLYWHGFGEATAIRVGDWKLFFGEGHKPGTSPDVSNGPALFNLAEDPGETKDLSAQHPKKVEEMLDRAKAQLKEIQLHSVPLGVQSGFELKEKDRNPEPKWGKWIR